MSHSSGRFRRVSEFRDALCCQLIAVAVVVIATLAGLTVTAASIASVGRGHGQDANLASPLAPSFRSPASSPAAPSGVESPGASATAYGTSGADVPNQTAPALASDESVPPTATFLPASPREYQSARTQKGLTYLAGPAPMGLSDLGVSADGNYTYTTSSFQGTIHLTSLAGFSPGYGAWYDAPNWVTIQLNTVATYVPLPDFGAGIFWLQNVARTNGTRLQLDDNIWNFSAFGAHLTPNTISSYDGAGVRAGFYYDQGPVFNISFPLTLTLYDTIGVTGGFPVVWFNYSLSDPVSSSNGTFDSVVFSQPAFPQPTPTLLVSGFTLTPFGLPADAELVVGGDGNGAIADVQSINGTFSLDYWNSTLGTYLSIPAAYDYGTDAGETSEGVALYYVGANESVNTGPSFRMGLWNTTNSSWGIAARPGWIHAAFSMPVEGGYMFALNGSLTNFDFSSIVPLNASGDASTDLPPPLPSQPYIFGAWANGRSPNDTITVSSNITGVLSVRMTPDPGLFDAPIYLENLADVRALANASLNGVTLTPGAANLWLNNTEDSIAPPFLQLSETSYPIYLLFAAEGIAPTVVHIDNLTQTPSTFVYSFNATSNWGFPGMSQGYYFYGAPAGTSIENVSLFGGPGPGHPPRLASIEFFRSSGVKVANITAGPTGVGLYFDFTNDSTVTSLNVTENLPSDLARAGLQEEPFAGFVPTTDRTHFGTFSTRDSPSRSGDFFAVGEPPRPMCPAGPLDLVSGLTQFAFGACVLFSTNDSLSQGRVNGGGSWGLSAWESQFLRVQDWNVTGDGTAGQLVDCTNVVIDNSSALDSPLAGWNLTYDRAISLTNLRVVGLGTIGIFGWTNDSEISVTNLTALDGALGATWIVHSIDLTFDNVTAINESFGIYAYGFDTNFSARHILSDTASYGVAVLWITNGTIQWGTATNQSILLLMDGGENLSARNVSSAEGSMAVDVSDMTTGTIQGITARNESVAVDWGTGSNGSISAIQAANDSTAVDAVGLVNGSIANVNSSEARPGLLYFINPVFDLPFAVGAVQLSESENVQIVNVTADDTAFAIWDLASSGLDVQDVRSWNGWVGVQLNYTTDSLVAQVFTFGDFYGVNLQTTTNVTVEASTIEDSRSYGAFIVSGLNFTFFANNFVGNDGASVTGSFNPALSQAVSGAGARGNFSWNGLGNYWSDWSSTAAYAIGPSVEDAYPQGAFIAQWLEFREAGLLPGLAWGVILPGVLYPTAEPAVWIPSWSVPYGSIGFAVAAPDGWSAAPKSGAVSFNGSNQTVLINFSRPYFSVTFDAAGLPAGSSWTVSLGGIFESNRTVGGSATDTFTVPNGTYDYAIAPVEGYTQSSIPYSGLLTINGSNVNVGVAFSLSLYDIRFTESGLPAGLSWSVVVNGTTRSSVGGPLDFPDANGTYSYLITGIPGWTQSTIPYRGNLTIAGSNDSLSTSWREVEYGVRVSEQGLASGVEWAVSLDGSLLTSSANSTQTSLPNGTYPFTVDLLTTAGYTVSPDRGNLTVDGSAVTLVLVYRLASTGSTTALPWGWVAAGAISAGGILGVVWAIHRGRRPHKTEGVEGDVDPPETSGQTAW